MTSTKRTIVRVETKTLSVIRPAGSPVESWCDDCEAVVPMVTPEHAAQLCSTTPRTIYKQIENGELHFMETPRGDLFVCGVILNRDPNLAPTQPDD